MHKHYTGTQLRRMFLDYFQENNHMIEPSASLVPINDATLLWINSGVAALKKYFDGSQIPNNPRIVNSQKAIRTNDIENVGFTARHHTFFEMLGNFSIGDYFRQEAIEFAWDFLTNPKWVGLEKDKLYVTIHPDDQQSFDVWHKVIGLDKERIFKLEGNFWQIGEGPCGPNTEIFYDRGTKYDTDNKGLELLANDLENDRYIEIWNVVLSQYNAQDGLNREDYQELPQKNIDTGMGLERLACIVQRCESNFETDFFMPLIEAIEKLSPIKYQDNVVAYRVIADHIRTLTFALNDGALFSNEGRGYVLRRLLRRASRYARELEITDAFMASLVDIVISIMEDFYSFETDTVTVIKKMIHSEEQQFTKTLQNGLKHLEDIVANLDGKDLEGEQAFVLYDTYGFPLELTVELCQQYNITVDIEGFDKEMSKQKQRARDARKDDESMAKQSKDLLDFKEASEFVGYEKNTVNAKIIAIFKDGERISSGFGKMNVVLDITPFYAEGGGEVADTGILLIGDTETKVLDVTKLPNGQHIHVIDTADLTLNDKDTVVARIDRVKRLAIQKNHTAAHLFFALLRKHLGNHVMQAGSQVDKAVMRFDFTHYEKVPTDILMTIEVEMNDIINQGIELSVEYVTHDQAQAMGAIAQFDEKYGDIVRVVTIPGITIDLCGGCHVRNTADLGIFKIESESSVGSGVRRVSAYTASNVYRFLNDKLQVIQTVADNLKVNNESQIIDRIISNEQRMLQLESENAQLVTRMNVLEVDSLLNESTVFNDNRLLIIQKTDMTQPAIKQLLTSFTDKAHDLIVVAILNSEDEQVVFAAMGQKAITDELNCQSIIKSINATFDGKGGGKRHLAQAKVTQRVEKETISQLLINNFNN